MTFTAEATDVDLKLPEWAEGKTFKDTASIEIEVEGEILSYEWDFGDGNTATTEGGETSHTYEQGQEDPYTAEVTVKCDDVVGEDGENEKAEATVEIKVSSTTLKVTPDSTWVYAGGEKEFTVKGYDKEGKEVELDGSKVEWSTTAGEMNPSSGQTTSTLTAQETPLEEGTVTATYPEATDGEASVRVWPQIGEMSITGPATGRSGEPCEFEAYVKDECGNEWEGEGYPVLHYSWWECGGAEWTEWTTDNTYTYTWYPSFPFDFYFVRFRVKYTGPVGSISEYSDTKKVVIFWWPTRGRKEGEPPRKGKWPGIGE